ISLICEIPYPFHTYPVEWILRLIRGHTCLPSGREGTKEKSAFPSSLFANRSLWLDFAHCHITDKEVYA
ncbi:hypothetical protein KAT73_05115, partial [candidate division WOR-3 bacterium]|nr:hypothetical protein [candidate division WOR-3 bacterium]